MTEKTKNKDGLENQGGRPRKEIDWDQIKALCEFAPTASELVHYLSTTGKDISYDTLNRRTNEEYGISFAKFLKQKVDALAKIKLRKLQWKAAEAGNVSMLIWLGKQLLDQTDKGETTIRAEIDSGEITYEQLQQRARKLGITLPESSGEDDTAISEV